MGCDKQRKLVVGVLFSIVLLLLVGFAGAESYKVDLDVEFQDLRNGIFPCSIKICVDDDEIVTTGCKGTYSTQLEVEKGRHTFWFYLANKGIFQALSVDVVNNMKVKCRVNADDTWPKIYLDDILAHSAMIIPNRYESEGWHCSKCGKLSDLFFPDCVYCGDKRPANKIVLSLKCKANRIFSRYDVNVYVDNVFYAKVNHGESSDLNCYLSSGKHVIRLQKFDDPKLYVEKEIQINNISSVSLDFEVNRSAINITDYKSSSKKLDAYYVRFLRQKGTNTTGFSFNTDEMRFSYYSKTSPSYGKNDWSEKGSYTVDSNGFVTLMYDNGTIEYYRCETVLYLHNNPEEALIPVANKTITVGPREIDDSAFVRKR